MPDNETQPSLGISFSEAKKRLNNYEDVGPLMEQHLSSEILTVTEARGASHLSPSASNYNPAGMFK